MAEIKVESKELAMLRFSNVESNRISRECLRIALIQLMSEKELHKITITELVKRAGVSRATFYRNYETKESLVQDILDSLSEEVRKLMGSTAFKGDPKQLYLQIFQKIEENAQIFRSMFSTKIPTEHFLSTVLSLENEQQAKSLKSLYCHLASEGAFIFIVKEWFLRGMQESTEKMAELCAEIIPIERLR